jgi:hypothetical protein
LGGSAKDCGNRTAGVKSVGGLAKARDGAPNHRPDHRITGLSPFFFRRNP